MQTISTFSQALTQYQDVGLFIMRLMVGGLFLYSGQLKIRDLKKFAEHNQLPIPVAGIVAFFELVAGLALILGILTQMAALIIIGIMLGALYHHIFKWKSPYWAQEKGWEYDLMWVVMCLVILLTGGGEIGIYPTF